MLLQASTHGAINMVHILVDRTAQCLLFQSPLFRSQIDLKVKILSLFYGSKIAFIFSSLSGHMNDI